MSQRQYGIDAERRAPSDTIRRARERAEAGTPRDYREYDYIYDEYYQEQQPQQQQQAPQQQPPRRLPPQAVGQLPRPRQAVGASQNGNMMGAPQATMQRRNGPGPPPTSRVPMAPNNNAQWPLDGPLASPVYTQPVQPSYREPPRSQPPQRPARPAQGANFVTRQDGQQRQQMQQAYQTQEGQQRQQMQPGQQAQDGQQRQQMQRAQQAQQAQQVQQAIPVPRSRPPPLKNLSETTNNSLPTTSSSGSRDSALTTTSSSIASIPEFPMPVPTHAADGTALPIQQQPLTPGRRSANLGPPPSARRGLSSFYSHNAYVSPIPEESPRSKTQSHTSYASSTAMGEGWANSPSLVQPYSESILDVEPDSTHFDEDGDESQLVRSASLGRRGKPTLITSQSKESKMSEASGTTGKSTPKIVQAGTFADGTALVLDGSSSSAASEPQAKTSNPNGLLTADAILSAYDAAASRNPSGGSTKRLSVSPARFSRLSAIRQPPKLDITAVRDLESRGSMTSLPDLIRRATTLAASLDRGKRPASRMDELDFAELFNKKSARKSNLGLDLDDPEKHQSGLSDMLASFPNPSRTDLRHSVRGDTTSWPYPAGQDQQQRRGNGRSPANGAPSTFEHDAPDRKRSRKKCCGLPLWLFILVLVILLIAIAAAIVIPLEFLVLRKQKSVTNNAEAAVQQCQSQITCQNGGTNVVNNGFCSCICTNGFTGFDCSLSNSAGCTTANIQGATDIKNVTLGDNVPRLIVAAASNFSIPLSGTEILSKFNAGNLSCVAENALVTFDTVGGSAAAAAIVSNNAGVASKTVLVVAGKTSTTTVPYVVDAAAAAATATGSVSAHAATTTMTPSPTTTVSIIPSTTTTITITITPSIWPTSWPISLSNSGSSSGTSSSTTTTTTTTTTTSSTTAPATSNPSDTFTPTDTTLDFARVAVLYILQEKSLADAETAQATLQRLFSTSANPSSMVSGTVSGVSNSQAGNVTLGDGNSVDLIGFKVDVGAGVVVGGGGSSKNVRAREES